jgi:two-component system, NtrC family, nitrogen regulation sensor histidine kinase NtrY
MRYLSLDNIQQNRWKIHGSLSIVLLILFLVVALYQKSQLKPERISKLVQEKLIQQQTDLEKQLKQIGELFAEKTTPDFSSLQIEAAFNKQPFSTFISYEDSLVFWNDNNIPLSADRQAASAQEWMIRLENGHYLIRSLQIDNFTIEVLSLIKHEYPYQNTFLTNDFSEYYDIKAKLTFYPEPNSGDFTIYGITDSPLFSISVDQSQPLSMNSLLILFGLLLILQAVIYAFIVSLHQFMLRHARHRILQFIFIAVDLLIIRFIQRTFEIPGVVFDSPLFSATFYSSGLLFPNFGELILNVLTILFIAISFYRTFIKGFNINNSALHYLYYPLMGLLAAVLFSLYIITIESLLYHSSIPLSFAELYKLNALSYLSFLMLSCLSIAYFLIAETLFRGMLQSTRQFLTSIGFIFALFGVYWAFSGRIISSDLIWLLPVFLYATSFYHQKKGGGQNSLSYYIWPIMLFSLLLTMVFYKVNQTKTDEELELTSLKLGTESDPVFEFLFASTKPGILNDTTIQKILTDKPGDESGKLVFDYLKTAYLYGYYDRFDIHLTICDSDEMLNIQPDNYVINCKDYFDGLLYKLGDESKTQGLYLIRDNLQGTYYVAEFGIPIQNATTADTIKLYLEFYYKFVPEGLGYPELLVDENRGFSKDLSKFSFARYADSVLVYKFGNYLYPNRSTVLARDMSGIFSFRDYRHIAHTINDKQLLVVSKRNKSLIDIIAPFSYFFIFLSLMGALVFYLGFGQKFFGAESFNFRMRLQIMIVGALLFSFVAIGVSSVIFIRNIYAQKNNDMLTEKTQSILIEIEHKLRDQDIYEPDMQEYLYQLLVKFSLVFFSDINLYAKNGELMASSRPEIFEKGLLSRIMHPVAFSKMHDDEEIIFIQQEQIGAGTYLSSYIPFSNSMGEKVAYINLPYFARESELRNEISSFVLTYVNIFFLLTGLSVLMALLLSRRLTSPLSMIQAKMKSLKFGSPNEKIAWKSKDEIGQLVSQYNHMIDELAKSAALLARSERESAWREMARQVAHEIKNPLTPMRLSVQHLNRAWNDKDPEMEAKLRKTTQTIIEQIDTLSEIASAFSDFAKMPRANPEIINLEEIIQKAIRLYSGMAHIRFSLENQTNETPLVLVDQKNMNRVFNNLFKNAIQALEKGKEGRVNVTISRLIDNYLITIADNGKGMDEEQAKKIFAPYFTTKTSGMGIGLSIVYNIITSSGGTISFETEPGKGTTFTILLPVCRNDQQS